eukprot:680976-Ditylum_brightwellii.AAC.1
MENSDVGNNCCGGKDDHECRGTKEDKKSTGSSTGAAATGKNNTRSLTIKKLLSHPPIFCIPNFLTPAECLALCRLACTTGTGLQDGYVDSNDGLLVSGKKKEMHLFDANDDGRLSINELICVIDDFFELHITKEHSQGKHQWVLENIQKRVALLTKLPET